MIKNWCGVGRSGERDRKMPSHDGTQTLPTGKMGLWVLCKEIMGQINYSGSYVEDGFKEGIRPSERPVGGVITVQKIIRALK